MDTYDTGNPSYWEGRERWREAGSAFQPQHHYGTVACVSYLLWKTEGAFWFPMQESRARNKRKRGHGDWAPCSCNGALTVTASCKPRRRRLRWRKNERGQLDGVPEHCREVGGPMQGSGTPWVAVSTQSWSGDPPRVSLNGR